MKRNRKERLLILQNILIQDKKDKLIMDEEDVMDEMDNYVEKLPSDMQRLYKLYYIDTINHRNIGIRYGISSAAISTRLKLVGEKLTELIKGKR